MWQVLLAAAVAGSGILAKRFISPNTPATCEPISDEIIDQNLDQPHTPQTSRDNFFQPKDSIFHSTSRVSDNNHKEGQSDTTHDGPVFRFSSTCYGSEMGSQNHPRKKVGSGPRGFRGKLKGFKKIKSLKAKKKCGFVAGGQDGMEVDQRKTGIGKKFYVCLKKRRISKCATGKCESCSSKESSLFSWGLSIGIMYMMSAGNAEIYKLNTAMGETARVVQELKAELMRRKRLLHMHSSILEAEAGSSAMNSRQKHLENTSTTILDRAQSSSYEEVEDVCMSNNHTEELPEELEMNQLEAEFFSELQKLPCAIEGSGSEGIPDIYEVDMLGSFAKDYNANTYQSSSVSPSVLDQKLSHLLIEQQENHIVQLESELQQSNCKLHEKEAELQALKDCVRQLTELSLASVSDEENEGKTTDDKGLETDPTKPVAGMKRGMEFELYER